MKAICIVVQNFYDLDVRVRRKAEALVAAGYSVDVLALGLPQSPRAYELNGVNVYTLSLGKRRGSVARYLFEYTAFFLWTFLRVPLMMRRRRYAVIDVNTLPDLLIFAPVLARFMGAKLLLDMHEITPEFYMSKYGLTADSWVIRFLRFQERISFNFADDVITINEPIQDLLVERGLSRSKSTVVMNATDQARPVYANSAQTPSTSPAANKFVMMYHGTLTKIYGLDIAIQAFSTAHHEMPEAELWILGSGPEAGPLARLSEQLGLCSKVKLVGQVPPSEIPAWLNQCTVGILPIRRDVFLDFAFPNKLPEFIVAGKPVIMSRLNAIRHYFSEDALAYVEPNSPADLAIQMRRVYRDPVLRERLLTQARTEYVAIRWEVMKHRYLTLVEEMIAPVTERAREIQGGA